MAKNPRYDNIGGRFDRTSIISISTTLALSAGTVIGKLIDGALTTAGAMYTNSGQAGKRIDFDFGSNPKKITGFSYALSNISDTTVWKLQASLDGSTYVDITGNSALYEVNWGSVRVAESLGINDGFYPYYRLLQVSGSTSSSPYHYEIEFRIVDSGSLDDKATLAPSYSSALGSGRRAGFIAISSNIAWVNGSPQKLFDGSNTNSLYASGDQSGRYIEFDFGTPSLITEVTLVQDKATSHGTWKWQRFDGTSWVDVGGTFTLGSAASTVITTMSGDTQYATRFRLTQVSGTTSSSPYWQAINFKIGHPEVSPDGVSKDLILSHSIPLGKDLILDYSVTSNEVLKDLVLDYTFEFYKDLVLDHRVANEPNLWQHAKLIHPAGRQSVNAVGRSASSPTWFIPTTAGAINIPTTPVLPAGVTFRDLLFYRDYYERIWLDPTLIRLVNPRYNTPIQFGVWNSYSSANSLIEAVNVGLPGFVLNFALPRPFARYEFQYLTFSVTPAAPATAKGSFDFIFDYGQTSLDIVATIIEALRVMPLEPVREVWSWKTVLQTSYDSTEQRMAYRSEPRISLSLNTQLLDEKDRKRVYRQLYTFIARTIRFPFFQYRVGINAPALSGTFKLLFDPTKTDLRNGEYAALMNPLTDELYLVRVGTVDVDGCTLDLALDFNVSEGWSILPTVAMRIPDASALQMRATDGQMGISGESVEYRTLLRPGQTAALTAFDGLPVLHHRPIAQRDISEAFYGGSEVIDNESVMPRVYTAWDGSLIGSGYEFKIDRETELDYWRQFGKSMQGRQNPFLMPTWRSDLELLVQPALGDIILHVDSAEYLTQFEFDTYKRLQLETANGVIYRKVTSVEDDGAGGCVITLATPLGLAAGDNDIRRVSFLNLARLDNDSIELTHFVNWTIVSIKTRTINA